MNTGRFPEDTAPLSFPFTTTADFKEQFADLMQKRQTVYETLSEADLARELSYLGKATHSVARLIRAHAGHFTGHTWQIRYIRGIYSRAFGTDKTVFDPF